MDLTDKLYWEQSYTANEKIEDYGAEYDLFKDLIDRYIPNAEADESVLEVGCCPGRFLTIFGRKGFCLNGIDIIPSIKNMKQNLEDLGFKTGCFNQLDFRTASFSSNYNLICSFGLIEHFTDWEAMITRHTDLVKDGGYLVITTPNFKGLLQYLYHRLTDKENLERHVIGSMRPKKWKKILEAKGFTVLFSGHFGNSFWDENNKKKAYQVLLQNILKIFGKSINKIFPGNSIASSFCAVIAKKSNISL